MSARVLVVDDIEINVRLLEAKLLNEYYDVLTAKNGQTALDIARSELPDIVLLDVMMPGMDGLEVCRRLKADHLTRHIPVVMVTALSDLSDRLRGLEVGADDFLTKPLNDLALFARVRSLVRLKRTMDEWLLREEINGRLAAIPDDGAASRLTNLPPPRLLILEDDALTGNRLRQILEPHAAEIRIASGRAEAMEILRGTDVDLIMLSMALASEDPLRLLSQARADDRTRHIPVLLMLEDGDYAKLAKGLDLGANDYIFRPVDRNELIARVRIQVKRKKLQEELHDNYKRGVALALTDPLTGLYNRRYLDAHLDSLVERPGGGPARELSVMMIDIDHFKAVNDTWGHPVGDAVLVEVAKRAIGGVRGVDLVARYGGEEFAVVLPDTSIRLAFMVADRLRQAIVELPVTGNGVPEPIAVSVSIGVAASGSGQQTPVELLKNADQALYAAKRGGRNRVVVWGEDIATGISVPALT